ncbi:type VI secretion system, VipA protein [Campylobacter avium LMG 24591]|uniref:Type VI secretion system, VipA protein n=1 Tax=Campylobacter avium LMG 24591 TaxID=522484 RepID=A0A222MXD1_9BACT|nr:type VI secretion system contractile sheath small subunit [Campylobacter avium]ASQ30481.1 type VI secretion system, VipA protein [Campylobacter avium LMG 24591]OYD79578.1 type VI secretion system, VipA protein [Campylobacter avium]
MANSQKFVGKNRAPRVQVEYDVELYGAEKKVNLPFVMGVLSDLSGKSEIKTKVDDKNFIDIDSSNFNDVMKKIKPRVAFMVPNKLDESTQIAVDISFENMDDFSPAKIAKKVDGLKQILEAREQLANLLSYMDGKAGAEELLNKILNDDALLKALSAKAKETETKE